jgi:hypothetical protein
MTVLFSGRVDAGPGSVSNVGAPAIEELVAERSLWTVTPEVPGEPIAGPMIAADRGSPSAIDQTEHAVIRVEAITEAMRETVRQAADQAAVAAWSKPWVRRWALAYHQARRAIDEAASSAPTESLERRLDALRRAQAELAAELGVTSLFDEQLAARRPEVPPTTLGDGALPGQAIALRRADPAKEVPAPSRLYAAASGGWPRLALRTPARPMSGLWWTLLSASLWLGLTAAVAMTLRAGWLGEMFRRWPHAVGVLIGVIWWLWLWPSPIGLLLVFVSAATALRGLRPILPRNGYPATGSGKRYPALSD